MQRGHGEVDDETLGKIAAAFSVAPPTRETVLRFAGPPEKPRTAISLVREAQATLEAAARLLEREERIRIERDLIAREEALDEATGAKPAKPRRRAGQTG